MGTDFGITRSLLARHPRIMSVNDSRSICLTMVVVMESHTVEILTVAAMDSHTVEILRVVAAGGSHTVGILDLNIYRSLAKWF